MSEILTLDGQIIGNITQVHSIVGNISNTLSVQGSVSPGSVAKQYPVYDGVYNITPVATLDVILETSNKLLADDIIVNKIPYTEVSNLSGGYTVSIG